MQITAELIKKFKWQNRLFYLLFSAVIILTAMLSYKYQYISDWTENSQNSLNEKTIALLQRLEEPIKITSYTNNNEIKKIVKRLIARYQFEYGEIQLDFIDPTQHPQQVRDLGIQVEGELIIEMAGRIEHLTQLNESKLTNSIFRLARQSQRKVLFIEGHGERKALGKANFDLGEFSQQLHKQGFEIASFKLTDSIPIDANNDVLIIAGPQADYLNGEVQVLLKYIEQGVNFLWLLEPLQDSGQYLFGLAPLAERLGLEFNEGVVVDTSTRSLQLERPDYAIISDYINHPLTASMQSLTIFPQALAIDPIREDKEDNNQTNFSFEPILLTIEQSWVETSEVKGTIHYDADEDTLGPLIIGVSQTRKLNDNDTATNNDQTQPLQQSSISTQPLTQQRVVVIGDGDFLSNAFVANGGNLELGLNIFNWLSQDDQFIAIPAKEQPDVELNFSETQLMVIGFVFFMLLPALFILIGLFIRFKRRKREMA